MGSGGRAVGLEGVTALPRTAFRIVAALLLPLLAACSGPSDAPPLASTSSDSGSAHLGSSSAVAQSRPIPNPAPAVAALTASEPGAVRSDAASGDGAGRNTGSSEPPGTDTYLIGPGDDLNIFVWRNPDLSVHIPVRPDGKISIPLVEDIAAIGKTPTALAREIEDKLRVYVKDPIVTVIVSQFVGPFAQQVRVIGEAAQPRALPYRRNMSLLDVVIEVGGLTRFAAGNRAVIVRNVDGKQETIKAHLGDLVNDGDIAENVAMRPGDILVIPQRYF